MNGFKEMTPTERIAILEKMLLRNEMEIEIYRQIAIELYHYEHSTNSWEKNAEIVDQEHWERMQRLGIRS